MFKSKWFWLQLFGGEGGTGASGGEGGNGGATTTGVESADPGRQRLLELGVPEEKLNRRRTKRAAAKLPEGAVRTAPVAEPAPAPKQVVTAAEKHIPTEEATEPKARMSWDEIMNDPEYNQQMQKVVQSRLRSAKAAEENLGKMAPAMELLARKYGLNMENMDYDALAKAINDDEAYYEDKALEMGVSLETAKRVDQQEREAARTQRMEQLTLEQQKIQNHFASLEQQSERMKSVFPNFDLRTELQNPVFARLTSPDSGIDVETAYHAVHRKEIMSAGMQVTAQKTAEQISNAIRSGSMRPDENGTSGQAPSVTTFDYSKASKAEREALKREIYAAKARGEKLYPGRR